MTSSVEIFRGWKPMDPRHEWWCKAIRSGALEGPCNCGVDGPVEPRPPADADWTNPE